MAVMPGANPYDIQRQQVQQRTGAQIQTAGDAMNRRFAAAGALNSGNAIKAQQVAQEQAHQQQEQALQGVDAQEAQANQARADQQAQRDFASGEALKGRTFQGDQAGIDRAFKEKAFGADQLFRDKEFAANQDQNAFLRRLEKYKAGQSGGMFGGGGFLGLGIGATPAEI